MERQEQSQRQSQSQEQKSRSKKESLLLLLLLLLVSVTVGYAILSTTINISGTSTINNNTWDIDVPVIECPEGEVCTIEPDDPEDITPDDGRPTCTDSNDPSTCTDPTGAVIWMKGNTIYFKHVLTYPGDVFTFTAKFANNGTIDAKVSNVATSELNATAQRFLTYSVTYADGSAVNDGDLLKAGESVTYKVTVAYKSSVTVLPTPEELALINEIAEGHTGATSLFTVTYEQK